jgi:hypothetical protein
MKIDPSAPYYVKVKRGKRGVCNICLNACDLKWDHVPPQGGLDVAPLDQYTILERLAGRSNSPNYLLTQNGVKFRTLCYDCNSTLLGGHYDNTLNDFALGVGRFLKTTLLLPTKTTFVTRPAQLLRALFGHLLAAKSEVEHTKQDEAMRQFVLSPTAALPPELNVFYWVYPYPEVHAVRDVALSSRYASLEKPAIFSILKYFPVAYLVTNLKEYEGLSSLSFLCPSDINEEVKVPVNLAGVKPPDWPDDANNIIAGGKTAGNSSVSAFPKGTNIRRPTGK